MAFFSVFFFSFWTKLRCFVSFLLFSFFPVGSGDRKIKERDVGEGGCGGGKTTAMETERRKGEGRRQQKWKRKDGKGGGGRSRNGDKR